MLSFLAAKRWEMTYSYSLKGYTETRFSEQISKIRSSLQPIDQLSNSALSFSMCCPYRFPTSIGSNRFRGLDLLAGHTFRPSFSPCSRVVATSGNGLSDCHPVLPVPLYRSSLRRVISAKTGSISQVKHRLLSLSQPRSVVPECAKKSTTLSPAFELAAIILSIAFRGFWHNNLGHSPPSCRRPAEYRPKRCPL